MLCDKIITVVTKYIVKNDDYIFSLTKTERMIIILFKKFTATVLACLMTCAGAAGYFENFNSAGENGGINSNNSLVYSIKAEAASVTKPTIKLHSVHGDKINILISNSKKYKSGTKFNVYVNNKLALKNVDLKKITKKGYVSLVSDGKTYFKTKTTYKIKLQAVQGKKLSSYSSTLSVKTNSATYFYAKKGTQLYKLSKSKMVKSNKLTSSASFSGVVTNAKGTGVKSKSFKKYKSEYIKITNGVNKGKYIKISDDKAYRISKSKYKQNIVVKYAASMNGGRYVYGGCRYRATDCSGLVMLSYKQIGVNLPHSARQMRNVGKSVKRSNMQAGDIIVMNGGSHVGMYIGNNKFVHAMNSRDGIKIQAASNLKYYTVNTIRRVV